MKALLIIDVQAGLTKRALYLKDLFISTVNRAIDKYRENNDLVIFVQHENNHLIKHSDDWQIDDNINSDSNDSFFSKTHGNAFTNKELVSYLNSNNINNVLVSGLVTHGCVMYTCKGAKESGFSVSLLKNGHSCWNQDAKDKISKTESALAEIGINTIDISEI